MLNENRNIGVLVSGGGTVLQAILDAINSGGLDANVVCVASSRKDAYALTRAKDNNIPASVIRRKDFPGDTDYADALSEYFEAHDARLILLCGFLTILPESFLSKYSGRIMNIHPSLIPSFCGHGYYGLRVHEEVISRGVKITGATVHFVNEQADGGPIIIQKSVPVLEADTPQSLQKRVYDEAERVIYPIAIKWFFDGKLIIRDNWVSVTEGV